VRIEVVDTGRHRGRPGTDLDPYVQLGGAGRLAASALPAPRAQARRGAGDLGVWSDGLGRGSTFTVLLPRAPGPAPKEAAASPALRIGVRRLLLAEDHEDSARMIGDLLKARGFEVTSVGTVAAGLAALATSRFDVLVSDLELPDGTGLDLMRKSSVNGIRAIALSGRRRRGPAATPRVVPEASPKADGFGALL
jgi:hypothetical protein